MLALLPPVLGQFTAFFLFYSACPGLMRDRRAGQLASDPIPFPVALTNTLVWLVYGLLINDVWIVACNLVGLAATSFNTVTVLRLCREARTSQILEAITVGGLIFAAIIIALTTSPMFVAEIATRRSIGGYACIAIVLVMFASPTVAAVSALRTGNASQVSLPLSLAQLTNGLLWGIYGAVQQDPVVMGPNLLGAALANVNVFVKLRSTCGAPKTSDAKATEPKHLVEHGGEVLLRSMFYSGYVHVASQNSGAGVTAAEDAMEADQPDNATLVMSNGAEGSVLRIMPLPVRSASAGQCIALQVADGRFLCVQPRPDSALGSQFVPSNFQVVALHRAEAGPEGEFIPVYGKAFETDPVFTRGDRATHAYCGESMGFWNPKHRVFVRANETGTMDCSPVCNSTPSAGIVIPAGWEWERFTMIPVHQERHETTQARQRSTAIGRSGMSHAAASAA